MVTAAVETVAVQCHGVSLRGTQCKRFRWLAPGTRWGCTDHPLRPDEQPELEPAPVTPDGAGCQVIRLEAEGEQLTARVQLRGKLNGDELQAVREIVLAAARRIRER